jgi:hypothetical protein
VIYTIAPSPIESNLIWAGTDDGLIHVTRDGGATWTNVTPPALTPWAKVSLLEASHFDANSAYAAINTLRLDDLRPHIYRTRDLGKTWQRISTGLPVGVYVHTVKEDPSRQGLLFAGTERGVFVSFDDGDHWQPLQRNLPATSMRDLEIYGNDLIVATHGRGFWVIDDISPLRQVDDTVAAAEAVLFKPADAILVDQGDDNGTPYQKDEPQAENPEDGAYLYYYLKADVPGPVTLEILDAKGTSLHTFSSASAPATPARAGIPNTTALWRPRPQPFSTSVGLHRVTWRPNTGRRGGFGPRRGPEEPVVTLPGVFTAKLTVNGKSYTQAFTVRPDPRSLAD